MSTQRAATVESHYAGGLPLLLRWYILNWCQFVSWCHHHTDILKQGCLSRRQWALPMPTVLAGDRASQMYVRRPWRQGRTGFPYTMESVWLGRTELHYRILWAWPRPSRDRRPNGLTIKVTLCLVSSFLLSPASKNSFWTSLYALDEQRRWSRKKSYQI